jgi:hypothetical protein
LGAALTFGALISMPLIFAVFGFVIGIIESLLYNLFAGRFGGINLDFK